MSNTKPTAREYGLRIRVTADERDQIHKLAESQGLSISGLVRKLLGLQPKY
jgi:uncharacterized protein (DUF1778 family)